MDQKPQLQKEREDEKAEGYVPDERPERNLKTMNPKSRKVIVIKLV